LNVLTKIERLKAKMNNLAAAGADYEQILKVSQLLDVYIVQYQKAMLNKFRAGESTKSNNLQSVG